MEASPRRIARVASQTPFKTRGPARNVIPTRDRTATRRGVPAVRGSRARAGRGGVLSTVEEAQSGNDSNVKAEEDGDALIKEEPPSDDSPQASSSYLSSSLGSPLSSSTSSSSSSSSPRPSSRPYRPKKLVSFTPNDDSDPPSLGNNSYSFWNIGRYLTRKVLWIAFIVGLFACLATSVFCTYQYGHFGSLLDEYDHANVESTLQTAILVERLEILGKKIDSLHGSVASKDDIHSHGPPDEIDWLSYWLGAEPIPYLTSSSSPVDDSSPKQSWYSSWLGNTPDTPENKAKSKSGPEKALQPWTEAEPRYCVSCHGGMSQLAVILPRTIIPFYLVIEHWREGEVPDIGNAPKSVEFWVHIENETVATDIREWAEGVYPGIMDANHPQKGSMLQALDFPWVPVGRFRYEIDAFENVQRFRIPYELEVPVQLVAIRVKSNWGNLDDTCLVRVRLHGVDKSGFTEKLDDS